MSKLDPLFTSDSPEWYTPPELVGRIVACLERIDLDPAAEPAQAVPAALHYTREADGLSQPWSGRVFLNPPYGKGIDKWAAKLANASSRRDVSEAIALYPARTDTHWFNHAFDADALCFLRGRVKFLSPEGEQNSAPFPSVLVYYGNRAGRFAKFFSQLGHIVYP